MVNNRWTIRGLAVLLAFALCGGPEAAQAWAQQSPGNTPEAQTTSEQDSQQAQTSPGNIPEGPTPQQKPKQEQPPLGTAAAPGAPTAGGAASRPAGNAIAPAHQRQVRSLLIKIGAIAAGGAALGIVYGLTRGTNSKPPGTH